jgi:nucleotide-binding universal stress UspA family protein
MSIRPPKRVDHRAATDQTSDDELFGSPDGSSSSDRDSDATTVVPRVRSSIKDKRHQQRREAAAAKAASSAALARPEVIQTVVPHPLPPGEVQRAANERHAVLFASPTKLVCEPC